MPASTWLPESCSNDGSTVATLLAEPSVAGSPFVERPFAEIDTPRAAGPALAWDDPLPALLPPLPVRRDIHALWASLSGSEPLSGREQPVHGANHRFACWHRAGAWHPRCSHRVPWNVPLVLFPCDESTDRDTKDGVPVLARDLSARGISIVHAAPIPYRMVRLRHVDADRRLLEFTATLRWCRFTRDRRYVSGGVISPATRE